MLFVLFLITQFKYTNVCVLFHEPLLPRKRCRHPDVPLSSPAGAQFKGKKKKQHGEIKEEGSFNPCLSTKSITPPHMAPTQSLIFEKNSVESPIKLMTDRGGWGGGDTEEGNGSFEL